MKLKKLEYFFKYKSWRNYVLYRFEGKIIKNTKL